MMTVKCRLTVCETPGMTLSELIAAYRGDVSYERLAKRTADTDGRPTISGAMLHNLARKPLDNIPRVETIHAIATALGVSPRLVLDSAAESVGLSAEQPDPSVTNRAQVESLVALVRHRPPEEVEHLSRVVGDVVRALDSRSPTTTSSPEGAGLPQ